MAPQAPWSPTAHAFAQHQFSQVANFWKQGRQASLRLEALPGGQAVLNLTFQLPSASEVIPPPSNVHTVPTPQRPIIPLFPEGFPQGSPSASTKVSSRQRKQYRRSVLHRAGLAASSLPSPKHGSLRQAASVCVQRLQSDQASKVNTEKSRKRPLHDSSIVFSPSNCSPLAQRIRSDLQIGEVESPEREILRTLSSPVISPSPSSPTIVKSFPPPAPMAFTPLKTMDESEVDTALNCHNCEEKFTPGHQCGDSPAPPITSSEGAVFVEEQPPSLPLCHYCCHRGSGKDPVHYFLQCVCPDWPCTCWCYCTDAQLEHKRLVFPAGFGLPGYRVKTVNSEDRPKARAIAEARTGKARPCDNPSCMEDFQEDNARALGQL